MLRKSVITYIFASVIMTSLFSMSYNYNTINFNNAFLSNSWMWIIIFVLYILLIKNVKTIKNKRLLIVSYTVGMFLSTLNTIAETFNLFVLQDINITKIWILYSLFHWISVFLTISLIIVSLYKLIDSYNIKNKKMKFDSIFEYSIKNYWIITGLIFLTYIPWLLHYFPGICSSDSTTQMLQIVASNISPLQNHHPVLHTLIIGLCLKVGGFFFHNNNAGIAIYSILQMLACSCTFSYIIFYCEKKKVPLFIRQLLLLFYMFCPIISSYSITMWKDIPFALSILISTTLLIDAIDDSKKFFGNKKNIYLLIFFLLLDIFLRKNGLYCVILAAIIYIIASPKEYKTKFLTVFIIPIIINYLVIGLLFPKLNILEGNSKEALSVPMQLFARVRKYHSNELTSFEKKEIDNFFYDESYIKEYNPTFADPIKRIFSEEYLKKHKKDVFLVYKKYSLKYPLEAVKSFICGSFGYYYPDLVGWEVYNKIYSDNITKKELKVKEMPIHKFYIIKKLEFFLNNHNIPLLSLLTSCGFYFWMLVVTVGYFIYKKKKNYIISTSLIIGVWGTALLSPVFCERRYVYSLFLVVPVLFTLCFSNKRKKLLEKKAVK